MIEILIYNLFLDIKLGEKRKMKRKKVFLSHTREQKWNFVSWVEKCLINDKTKPTLIKSDIFLNNNMKIGQNGEFEFWNVYFNFFF
jgi:hypothetical protein